MGLFNFFKKESNRQDSSSDNGLLGPTFLEGLTVPILNPKNLHDHEWRRQLKTPSGQTKFKIKYYGQLHKRDTCLIIGTDFAPPLVFAIDSLNGTEILLFDGCKHGYNALCCGTYTVQEVNNRPATNYLVDRKGNDTFEIIISTYNGIDYEKEFSKEVDEEGFIELTDGTKQPFETVKRNGYDTLQIFATNAQGVTFAIVSEELA